MYERRKNKNYFISSSQNDDKSKITYVVYNKKGKQIYKTQEKLEKINDDYILISSDNEKYSIVNKYFINYIVIFIV